MRRALLAALAAAIALAAPARADFPADPPNDPSYAPGRVCSPKLTGQWWLYSTIPAQCSSARDPEHAAGMSVDAAWREFTTGDPGTVIAYVEGGVNYRIASAKDLVDKIYLNTRELPLPQRADATTCAGWDCDGDGITSIRDYADDARIPRPYINGYLTPEDLVATFGHCRVAAGQLGECPAGGRFDNDGNGYPNDIAGWDFQHGTNDVQTDWDKYSHANQQTALAAAATNNGVDGAGVCPRCRLMYVKAGDEAIARPDRQALAVLYAVDAGANVIAGEAVTTGYSTFQRRAFDYAWAHGVPVSFDSNDFESNDHTDGMFFDHVLPANSIVQQSSGGAVTSFRNRSSVTSYGTHTMLTVPTAAGSTSESVPVQAGVMGLLTSYGRQLATRPRARPGSRGAPLSAGEVTQLMIASASRPDDPNLRWPVRRGSDWDIYYGYGRPNVRQALARIAAGRIPPVADITSPRWYARFDPAGAPRGTIDVRGALSAGRSRSAVYTVEYALGQEPAPGEFRTLARGRFKRAKSGPLATLRLSRIPAAFYARAFRNTGDRTAATRDLAPEQYAVTLRVRVRDDRGLVGVDRRAVYVQHDPDRLQGFPLSLGAGGDAAPTLFDLQGRGEANVVVGDADGRVHAYRRDGSELPGFPVRTDPDTVVARYAAAAGVRALKVPAEPVTSPVAVAPMTGGGRPTIVATTPNGRVYAWDSSGGRLPGFPVALDRSPPYPVPSPHTTGHLPTAGAFAPPVLADLDGDGSAEIVQATWDGHVHALRSDGSELPGWPVELKLPGLGSVGGTPGVSYFRDAKVIATPSVADLDGDHHPDVVVGSQESIYPAPNGSGQRPVYAIHSDGTRHLLGGPFLPGWPVLVQDTLANVSGGIDFAVTATSNAVLADFLGVGRPQVIVSTTFGYPHLFTAEGAPVGVLGGATQTPSGPDTAPTFTSSAAVARAGDGHLQLFSPGSAVASVLRASLDSGPITNVMRGWDLPSGAPAAGFPAIQQGLSFFSAPSIAAVEAGGSPAVLQTTDSMTLHAFRAGGGGEAAGFPKFTGGWGLFAPAVGDLDGDGRTDVVVATREGYLDAFRTNGPAGAAQWCGWQGNAAHTGLFTGTCRGG